MGMNRSNGRGNSRGYRKIIEEAIAEAKIEVTKKENKICS
jgi:hypothetical protein